MQCKKKSFRYKFGFTNRKSKIIRDEGAYLLIKKIDNEYGISQLTKKVKGLIVMKGSII